MDKRVVNNGGAIGPYSTAVVAGNHCYVAGTGGFVPGTAQLVKGGLEAEIRQAMKNLESNVTGAGFRLADVVSTTCYLKDLSLWRLFNEIYAGSFPTDPPARATVVVNDLPAGASVELSCIAWRDPARG
ncbi:MAG: RidA family protein [Acidimicrobiales bacterium]